MTSADSGVTKLTYDASGILATRSDANEPVPHRHTYDALNRAQRSSPRHCPADIEYRYDTIYAQCTLVGQTFSVGELTTLKAEGTEPRYCYDRFGQVVRSRVLGVGYACTPAGHLEAMTYALWKLQLLSAGG